VAEPGGYRGDLTDVDVDEALAEKSAHVGMLMPREPLQAGAVWEVKQSATEVFRVVRVFLLAFLLAVLALGGAAYADCTSCFTSVFAHRTSTNIDLSFTAQASEDVVLPDSVVAVVMQVDGNRTKCLNTTLTKTSQSHGVALYRGSFGAYGTYTHSGRIELAGQIYAFTVPLDGTPGKIDVAADQSPLNRNGVRVQVIAAVPVTPAPTIAPAAAGVDLPKIEPAFLIGGGVILITIVGAYVDRRRSLARSLSA